MKLKFVSIWSALALLAGAMACSKSSPTTPSSSDNSAQSATVALGKTGVTLTTPTVVSPADNQQFKFSEQPIKLTVANAVTSGSTAPAYMFEVATDVGFGNIVYSKAGGSTSTGNNQQTQAIDKLGGDKNCTSGERARSSATRRVRTRNRVAFTSVPKSSCRRHRSSRRIRTAR